MRMRGRGEGAAQPPTVFSQISSRAPVLCLQLSSTPCFFTLRDQAPGSTSLPSFVSDAAGFPCPLFREDCSFEPFCPSVGGSHQAMAKCRLHPGTLAGPCCSRCPETAARCQPAPEKVCESVAAEPQGLWKITTHIWHWALPSMTLFQHQQMWPFSGLCWDQVALTVSTKCPSSSGTAFPRGAREPPRPHSVPEDSPFPPEDRKSVV